MVTRARISEGCTGECNQGRHCTCRPERRIRFDHRLLLIVLACVYLPLLLLLLWVTGERV
jgi:hypothetical protein